MRHFKRWPGGVAVLIALLASDMTWAGKGGGGGGHGGGMGGGHVGVGMGGGHAGGWHGGGNFGGWHHHGHAGFGVFIGPSAFWPSYYGYGWPYYSYPPYYSSPSVVVPAVPPVYIEQGSGSKLKPLEADAWDYCTDPEGYYPHVKECPPGWQKIDPQPVGEAPGYWYYCSDPAGYYPYVRECVALWRKVVP